MAELSIWQPTGRNVQIRHRIPESAASPAIVTGIVDTRLEELLGQFEKVYSNSIIPTLFKNQKKCENLVALVLGDAS